MRVIACTEVVAGDVFTHTAGRPVTIAPVRLFSVFGLMASLSVALSPWSCARPRSDPPISLPSNSFADSRETSYSAMMSDGLMICLPVFLNLKCVIR